MATIESLKKKVIKHLNTIDLSSLTMQDLNTYVFTLQALKSVTNRDYMDTLLNMASSGIALGKAEEKEEK